jgi:hypothetical protein
MTTTTSQVHPEAVSGWSPIGPLVSRVGSSLAFTIPTGLAERRVFPLPSAFRTCYGPRCLSAQGQSRDLQHLSPMLTRCGNSALRDMAHMLVRPIYSGIPHLKCSSLQKWFLSSRTLILWRSKRDSLIIGSPQELYQGSASFHNRSSRVEQLDFPWYISLFLLSQFTLAPALCRVGLFLV